MTATPKACISHVFHQGRGTTISSKRQQADERLKVAIKVAHRQSRETYGGRRLQPELTAQGFAAARDRIARPRSHSPPAAYAGLAVQAEAPVQGDDQFVRV